MLQDAPSWRTRPPLQFRLHGATAMKKLINDPLQVVREMLEGVVSLAPELALLTDENVVVRRDAAVAARHVALLSGGGSGHEPAHAGYVGEGMLTAAVA